MKTYFSNLIKIAFVISPLALCNTSFGQKSINTQSVGTKLEEVSDLLYTITVETTEKITDGLTNQNSSSLSPKRQTEVNKAVNDVKDWSEVQYNEFLNVANETKAWLSKQYFAPLKQKKSNAPAQKSNESPVN